MTGTVAGVLLAAGAGRRLGRPKALVTVAGELLVDRGVRLLRAGGCEPVVVLLGAHADEVRAAAALAGCRVVVHAGWADGMGTSLRAALDALPDEADAVVVALVDQPLVGPDALWRLRRAWEDGAMIAVATYAGRPRNPVLFDRRSWPELRGELSGDEGARAFLGARPELVTHVACDDTGNPRDVDTPADLAAVAARLSPQPVSPDDKE